MSLIGSVIGLVGAPSVRPFAFYFCFTVTPCVKVSSTPGYSLFNFKFPYLLWSGASGRTLESWKKCLVLWLICCFHMFITIKLLLLFLTYVLKHTFMIHTCILRNVIYVFCHCHLMSECETKVCLKMYTSIVLKNVLLPNYQQDCNVFYSSRINHKFGFIYSSRVSQSDNNELKVVNSTAPGFFSVFICL